jgi:hypothetical protein
MLVLGALLFLQLSLDTLQVARIAAPPSPVELPDSLLYGPPQVRFHTAQGSTLIWFLQSADTFFIAASMSDSTQYWGDTFALSIDLNGDAGGSPGHDDFHWEFRRILDSSVVFRGRTGRWEPPKGDPDWRLGRDRSGGGWEVSGRSGPRGWSVLLRLDPVWLAGAEGRLPRLAVRMYDNDPHGWFAWPLAEGTPQPASVEQIPDLWAPVRAHAE